ncbi:MAG: PPC domain-containing protein, partial [Chloroflexi bacterium]|nr:PPC domain-containing protein [Chloroflexota bacterium]
MKYLSVFLLIAILLSVIFSPSDTFADDPDGISKEKGVPGLYGEYVPNQLLVTFQGWLTAEQIQSMANSYGFQVVDKSVDGQVYKISMPAELLQETLDKLAKDPNVLLVQPNHLKGFGPPETAIPVSQLGLSGIQALAEGPITEKPLADGKQGEEPPGKERGGTKSPAGDEGAATKGTDGEWVSSDRLDSSSAPPLGGEWTAGEKDVKSDGAGSFQAQQVSVTTITFDEVASGTPINGQTIEGVTFSFLVDGQPSTDARADFGGPGNSPLMRPPLLEGDPRGTLGLAFADPPTSINFAFSLLVGGAIPDGATLKLFNASNQLIGTFFQAASVPGSFFFPEAAVGADSQVPIARAEITFFANAERFALDNLQLNAGTAFVPPQVTGDDHGNLSSTATPLAIGQATNGSIQAVGDVDYFSFQGQSGVTYIIDTTLNGLADSYIILYGTDGVSSIAHDDDSGPGLASRLVFEPQASGGYFVEVRPFNSSQLGGYAITVAALTGDDGNAAATATSLALGQDRIAEIKPAGDVDFFSFSAQAGKAYGIQTALISLADSLLFLYDLNGVTLLASDDDGGPRLASSLAFTAPQAGTYFVEVRTFAAEQTGVYSLRVVEYQDDHANGFAGATPLTAQVRAAGVIEVNADLDYFRFVATAGSYYMLNTDTGTLEDTVLFLYDRDGTTLLAFDDDSGTGYASRIIFKPDVSVTYIVAVGAFD